MSADVLYQRVSDKPLSPDEYGQPSHRAQQYALPLHSRQNSFDATPGSGEQTPRAENSLRRKTPNGTLNAGYEGTLEEWQPQKHQLVPMPETSFSYGTRPAQFGSKRSFMEHHVQHQQQHLQQHLQQQQQYQQQSQHQLEPLGPWNSQPSTNRSWPGQQYVAPHQNSFPVMDSMLNQMSFQYMTPPQYYGQTVPSVVQPSFQYVGPTASGGAGPYGPYWHDGTYVPYRPAAVRDPRYYHNHFVSGWPRAHPANQPQMWQTAHQWQQPPLHPAPGFVTHSRHTGTAGFSGPSYLHYDVASPHRVPQHPAELTQSTNLHELSPNAEFGPSSPYGQQRDKTFAWALQQYRDLLGFIHQTRRQQHQVRPTHGPDPTHRPAFFPKPPKPSLSGSSLQRKTHRTRSTDQHETGSSSSAGPNDVSIVQDQNRAFSDAQLRNPSASTWAPTALHFQDNEYQRRSSYDQYQGPHQTWHSPLPHELDGHRALRRSIGSAISSMATPQLSPNESPPSRAEMALISMTKLCQDTDWSWTDGMHLCGCLAYGLSDYDTALKWYTKVLEMDPKHLEATSNLAATMLALGRRQEAEQHWTRVIKAAPNHFEAVEHLVGLLCQEQRSRDSVKVIEYVERCLRHARSTSGTKTNDRQSDASSTASRSPCASDKSDKMLFDFDIDGDTFSTDWRDNPSSSEPGFGSSGYAVPGCDNGRILALIHAKGNMLYGLGDNAGAAKAFEDAVIIAAGDHFRGIQGLVQHILNVVESHMENQSPHSIRKSSARTTEPILLTPDQALQTGRLCFPHAGELPGLQFVHGGPQSLARRAVISTTSNSLLSLAKIFQDGMANSSRAVGVTPLAHGVRDILALYYLSLALQPSPSTANNVGILLASIQAQAPSSSVPYQRTKWDIPGVIPRSGIALALQYYNYGLQLDSNHAHLYTNLGSLLKDIGQLDAAINMYERAVACDGKFDIALANLANAVKDKGRISDAIVYYKRAVEVSPDFAEAVCGLANALNSVCSWQARGGIAEDSGRRDRWHVDAKGMLLDAKQPGALSSGWIKRVVDIVENQLKEGEGWGCGTMIAQAMSEVIRQILITDVATPGFREREQSISQTLKKWYGQKWEGARITRLIERATRRISWQWYQDVHVNKSPRDSSNYNRPRLPAGLTVPSAPTVLPFHTFTCPMSAKQIRLISQRNGLRISVSTLRAPWLPRQVYPPPQAPAPALRVGYVSSDFNNHPLAHLMQSVFGMHDLRRVEAYCYATTASDKSVHRRQIEQESPHFYDASSWSAERLVNQIVKDGIHILVNLNGYTRGARNEVFAARPAPLQMAFMGFAGTLGAEWCDYLLADETAVPPSTLRPWRRNVDIEDSLVDENHGGDNDEWVYSENIVYCRDTFFCCDHRQSAPDSQEKKVSWEEEQSRRWQMRKELFPQISDETIIFGNFNQLYKIDPTTFRTWLRILARVPQAILWLLRFPDLGESHLLATARLWAGSDVASRVIFTDVAPKHLHISRARVCDVVLDTAECNAHTTAADVLWSGTPLLTLPRYGYKMCSRMAASILKGALPKNPQGKQAEKELIALNEDDYEDKAVALGNSLTYTRGCRGEGQGRLMELRQMLFHSRWSSALFDTRRWTRDLEDAYEVAWEKWVKGEGGDIWLDQVPSRARESERV